jgi:hypothetical protein
MNALRLIARLPRPIRRFVLDRRLSADPQQSSDLRATVATTREDALAAAAIVHDAYVARGLMTPHPTGIRVSPLQVLPQTFIIVAKRGDKVVGTITLHTDSPLGLPILDEPAFLPHVARLHARGRVVAEVGALAIRKRDRHTGTLQLLNRAMFDVAMAVGVDDLVIVVSSWAAELYESVLCFDKLGEVPTYPGLAEAIPSTALHLPLDEAHRRFETRAPKSYAAYAARPWPQVVLPNLSRHAHDAGRLAVARALVAARRDVFLELERAKILALRRSIPDIYWPTRSQIDPQELGAFDMAALATA